jgi:hypothetical protein
MDEADTRRNRAALIALVVALLGVVLVGCSSEDVTGEPEDIGTLVHVASGSECTQEAGGGEVTFRVRLENTGGDERTVTVIPRLRGGDGTESGDPLEGFEVTVGGGATAEGQGVIDNPPDDLESCFVQIDGGDDIPIETNLAGGG